MGPSRRKNNFRCSCPWTGWPHSKPRHCAQDADRRAGRQPNIPSSSTITDPSCRRCIDCGVPFFTSHRRSLECPNCGIVIAKTSQSASAMYDRDLHIFVGTWEQWKEEMEEKSLCGRCHEVPWVSAMSELCGPCETIWIEEIKTRQHNEWLVKTASGRYRMSPIHDELIRTTYLAIPHDHSYGPAPYYPLSLTPFRTPSPTSTHSLRLPRRTVVTEPTQRPLSSPPELVARPPQATWAMYNSRIYSSNDPDPGYYTLRQPESYVRVSGRD